MEETLTMSNKEIDRLKVIQNVIHRKLSWAEAGEQMTLSPRQIGRLCAQVRQKGNKGIIHGLRSRPSNHRLPPGLLDKALALVKERYADFNPTFANEKIWELHHIRLSTFTLRQRMIREGLWKSRKHRPKHHAWRERRPCTGMLVQLDGSDHPWFEERGPRCVLLIFIDDATSRILYGEFVPVEDTLNLLAAAKSYLLLHGRPISFYVDKDSIYKINRQSTIEEMLRDEQPLTQFTRAMGELDIDVICAHSPQAKGRVERGFKTHQDRLVKELRLAGISTMTKANRFLQDIYIPKHNARFAVEPANTSNAHRDLLKTHRLDEILSLRTQRTVFNDFTVRFHNQFFQLSRNQRLRVRPGNKVFLETRLDGSIHIRFKDQYLHFKMLSKKPYRHSYAESNTKQALAPKHPKSVKPDPHHPWRRFRLDKHAPNAFAQMQALAKT